MEKNLTTGSVGRQLIGFSLPYLLSYLLQTLYGMADLFIIGQYEGVAGTTAVAVGSQVMHMLTVMIVGLAMGTTVSIGRAVGAGDKKRMSACVGNTVTLFMLVSVVLTAALVLFSVDTAALVAGLVTAFEASSILDVVFHGLLLWYLAMGVRRGREAMEEPEGQRETPEPLPQNTEFYDASMGERPNSPSMGQPAEGKHRTLLTAAYGSHEIEVRRSYGLTELIVDGRVYGRQEGVVETGYTIRARVSGHDVETEFTPTGKQLLRVDGQVIARKQRLF